LNSEVLQKGVARTQILRKPKLASLPCPTQLNVLIEIRKFQSEWLTSFEDRFYNVRRKKSAAEDVAHPTSTLFSSLSTVRLPCMVR
jgi:hypothetical protein